MGKYPADLKYTKEHEWARARRLDQTLAARPPDLRWTPRRD